MRNYFWPLLSLSALVALLGSLADQSGGACSRCIQSLLPQFDAFNPMPVKLSLPYPPPPASAEWQAWSAEQRLTDLRQRVHPLLTHELDKHGFALGNPAFIRVFKESRELEIWLQAKAGWKRYRSYPIAAMSGTLGPKLREGDGQAPEGIYALNRAGLNPASRYHLSFNIGYPNAYDRYHDRTGSFIMVHGAEVSVGCFAMTDPIIEEIYLIVSAALTSNQGEIPIHVFPFHLTEDRLKQADLSPWLAYWRELEPVYALFEQQRQLPSVRIKDGRYALASPE